jgi:outer membrane receptor protein involved in Fe transport
VLLQAPGVSQDSAASGLFHVRNDHANVAYRINGILLPDGVTGFSSFLDTSLVGNLALVTGALPAEFGERTVGLIDITTRADAFNNSGSISMYGGSHGTIQPSFEYGGTFGSTCGANAPPPGVFTKALPSPATANCFSGVQYYFTGRYLQNTVGIENPLPTYNAIHDFTEQEQGFAYLSTFIDPSTRLSVISGVSNAKFQIPNVIGAPQSPLIQTAFGQSNFDSSKLNENQTEITQYNVVALQKTAPGFDGQISYFNRYDKLHFIPDPVGDLLLNGIASDVVRQSETNGLQGDGSFVLNAAHTLRSGFTVSGEKVFVGNTSLVETCMLCDGSDSVDPPIAITDNVSKLGWLLGAYVQDEWKVTDRFTINAGLRFDQMYQFVNANQFSPRINLTWKPTDTTTWHAGYARYFTPPILVEAAPTNVNAFANTTGAAPGTGNDPVLPERSHYFDAGVVQELPFGCSSPITGFFTKAAPVDKRQCANLELGADVYYKLATDLIDNGQFGQALVLDAFNYAKGINEGIELTAKFHAGGFQAYGNVSVAQQKAIGPVSNQFRFDNTIPLADLGGQTEFQYLTTHYIYTDHNQFVSGSAGLSYAWNDGTKVAADMFFGSGLRQGDANIDTVPPYAQFNTSISHEFPALAPDLKPYTIRFDVVNVFDEIYLIRSGSGIGVFAPQFGPRRGFFLGWTQKL